MLLLVQKSGPFHMTENFHAERFCINKIRSLSCVFLHCQILVGPCTLAWSLNRSNERILRCLICNNMLSLCRAAIATLTTSNDGSLKNENMPLIPILTILERRLRTSKQVNYLDKKYILEVDQI